MILKRAGVAILLALFLLCAGAFCASATISNEADNVRVVIYVDRAMFVFLNYISDQEYMVNDANALFAAMPDGVNRYLMVAPSRIAFEDDELRGMVADEREAARYVREHIDSPITYVDAYKPLSQYTGALNDLFFRLDHHWTQLGAYYAAQAFYDAAQVPYRPLSDYVRKEDTPFTGYMYLLSGDETLADFPDPLIYYHLPGNENKMATAYFTDQSTGEVRNEETLLLDPSREGYALFLDDFGFSHAVIPGNDNSDRALMILGGSSTYSIAPWLADNFKTVVLIETRFFMGGAQGLKDLIDEYGVTDMLLCVSFSTRILEFN